MNKMGSCKPGFEATKHPTVLDIIWASGIYEGEGCCSKNRSEQVSVGQKDTWILYKLQDLFGGKINLFKSTKGISRWNIYGARARGFLMTIYKFMSPRRKEQIRKVLGEIICLVKS